MFDPPKIANVEVDGKCVELVLWDTSGEDAGERIRPLVYPEAHVVLLCFAINDPDRLEMVDDVRFLLLD